MLRRIVFSVFLSSLMPLWVGGCRDSDPGGVVVARAPACEPDESFESDEIKGEFFGGGNCFTAETVARLRDARAVRAELDRFAARGYRLRWRNGFVVRGTSARGQRATITVLPLEADRVDHAVYVYCVEAEGKLWAVPAALDLPGDGDATSGPSLQAIEPVGETPILSGAAAYPSWRYWIGCLAEAFASRSMMCWATCRFVAVSYLQCMIVCESAAAVAAVVACTFRVLAAGTD